MSIRTYLQNLGATHLFDLDNNGTSTSDDLGDSQTPTSLSLGNNSSFVTSPTCEGVSYSLESTNNTNSAISGATATNVDDINADSSLTSQDYEKYAVILWVNQGNIWNATSIYEQGASVNNFAFIGGALTTWQAAHSGKPFLIIQSKSLTQPNRAYFYAGVWERYNQHAGTGNRILFYINGVLQGTAEDTNTDLFPYHAGFITLGNCQISLKSFNETTLQSQTVAKNLNFWATFNDQTLTAQDFRDIFERTTFAEVTIAADTVSNQQAALDALIGNTYQDVNCAIRILQATDQTNYRLFVDNINFIADDNIQDISIQFVGTGILTLENTNGTLIKYTSTPDEVEKTTGVITGGGSIVIVNNTIRKKTNGSITNSTATKLVLDGSVDAYTIGGGTISTIENITGNTVTVTLTNNAPTPTLIQTNGSITLIQNVNITAPNIIDGSRVQLNNVTKSSELDNSVVSGGNGYSYTVNLQSLDADAGDEIQLKATHQNGTSAKVPLRVSAILTSTGLSFIDSQENLTAYGTLGVDGSTVSEYNIDSNTGHLQIDANDTDCISTKKRIVARYYYLITTADGIDRFFNAIVLEDEANAVIDRSITSLMLDNIGNCTLNLTDNNFRLYTSDNSSWIQDPPTGGYGVMSDSGKVYAVNQDQIETIVNAIKAKTDLFTFTGNDVKATLDGEQVEASNMRGTDGANTTSPPTVESIADAVWDEPYNQHTTAGSFGKLMDLLRKANRAIDGEVTGTPTTSSFDTNLTDYTNGAFDSELMVFVSGTLDGEARPILAYTNGTFTFEEQWTQAPSSGDEFVILPYHTHPISEIQEGLAKRSELNVVNEGVKKASKIIPHNTDI